MIAFSANARRRPRLQRGQVLSLAELDALLDVKVASFDRTVQRLIKEFRAKGISVAIPVGEELIALKPVDSRVSWARLYEAQVQRLASMGRTEEFLMARRYDFFRTRARSILIELGFAEGDVPRLLRGSAQHLPAAPLEPTPEQQAHLDLALGELERLRNHYVEGALYMVLACAHRYRNLGVDFADLIQEGNASLFQAVEGFDWRRDVRFKTYAQYWIHQAILKALYNSSRTVRVPIWVQKTLAKIQRVRERGRQADGALPADADVGEQLGLPASRVEELLKTKRYAVSLDAEVSGEEGASLSQLLPDDRAAAVPEAIEDGNLVECLDEVMADLPSREHLILTRRFGLHGHAPETLGEIAADLGITAERVRQLQNAAIGRLKKPRKTSRLRAYT
jgi:RNA polymerase sigma factor (sigma-70 family)